MEHQAISILRRAQWSNSVNMRRDLEKEGGREEKNAGREEGTDGEEKEGMEERREREGRGRGRGRKGRRKEDQGIRLCMMCME